MHVQRLLAIPLQMKCRRLLRRLEEAAADPRAAQERVLLEKIRRNESSAFGREHGFESIRSVEDFRRRLPVAPYERFEPWIERVKRGDFAAMFGPSERVLMFALTSGTYAAPKYIPVTKSFLEEYENGWHVWGIAAEAAHYGTFDHTILRMVSPSDESYTESGVPCGAISGLITEGLPWYIRRKYTPPVAAVRVKHAPSKYYLIARIAIGRNVSFLSTANASTALAVVRAADDHREMLLKDLRDGTVDASWDVPPEVRRSLRRDLRPRPARARRLEAVVSRTGRLLPGDYWPELRLVGNWKGGSCGVYLARYPEYFGDIPVRDIGLLASEGRMTIPFSDEGAAGVLDVCTHFFEFIPEREIDSARPTTLLADELEEGGNYFILPTTSSGLYRYNIMDLVRVTGFFRRTPEVVFLNKGGFFSSLTGEKVSEFQVVESMARARAALACGCEDGLLSPMLGDPPRYSLAVEEGTGYWKRGDASLYDRSICPPDRPLGEGSVPPFPVPVPLLRTAAEEEAEEEGTRGQAPIEGHRSQSPWRGFLGLFEKHLRSINMEYESRRSSGRLGAPALHLLRAGTFERMKEEHVERIGGRREQYKHRFIVNEIDFHKTLPVVDVVELDEGERP